MRKGGLGGIQNGLVRSYSFQEGFVLVVVQDNIGTAAFGLRDQGYGGFCVSWTLHCGEGMDVWNWSDRWLVHTQMEMFWVVVYKYVVFTSLLITVSVPNRLRNR